MAQSVHGVTKPWKTKGSEFKFRYSKEFYLPHTSMANPALMRWPVSHSQEKERPEREVCHLLKTKDEVNKTLCYIHSPGYYLS
jgi:hypothetical protein